MKKTLKIIGRILIFLFIFLNVTAAFNAYKFSYFYNTEEAGKMPAHKTTLEITKGILFGFNAYKQKNEYAPDTAFQTVYLTTKDNLKLQGWYIAEPYARGTVCMFHGHGSNKAGILQEAAAFRKLGFNTSLIDFRAHGSSDGNTSTVGYVESEDVKLAYDFVKNKGETNIVLWGISMGAATITKAIHDYQIQPNKIILEMPFGSMLDAAEGKIRMINAGAQPLAKLIVFWGSVERGYWAFNMKPVSYAAEIKCPVLLQWGKNDVRVTERETMDIYANIHSPKKLVVYPNAGHESLFKNDSITWNNEVTAFLK